MKEIHMKSICTILVVLSTIFLTGCPKTQTPMPAAIRDQIIKKETEKLATLAKNYDDAVAAGTPADLKKAELCRNELMHIGILLIDENYNQFENDLFVGRARENIGADIIELGLSAATGISNGERVKTILGIAGTAFKGGRKSIDANLFRERSTEVIAQKMRGSRAKVLQTIYQGLGLPVDRYPLGAGLDDLINYLYAGSINNALLELSQDTGADTKQSRAKAATLKLSPFATEREKTDFNKITKAASDIKAKLLVKATEAQGRSELEAVLKQLYTDAQLGDLSKKSSEDMYGLLQDKMDEARDAGDEALRSKLVKALNVTP
jgi:hypothetical protein